MTCISRLHRASILGAFAAVASCGQPARPATTVTPAEPAPPTSETVLLPREPGQLAGTLLVPRHRG
ncbi:MAG TPA: hypothetical protein VGD77_11985, partial [Gemmatimonadaceae bacterium]